MASDRRRANENARSVAATSPGGNYSWRDRRWWQQNSRFAWPQGARRQHLFARAGPALARPVSCGRHAPVTRRCWATDSQAAPRLCPRSCLAAHHGPGPLRGCTTRGSPGWWLPGCSSARVSDGLAAAQRADACLGGRATSCLAKGSDPAGVARALGRHACIEPGEFLDDYLKTARHARAAAERSSSARPPPRFSRLRRRWRRALRGGCRRRGGRAGRGWSGRFARHRGRR
jgi:hypothetical protein